MYSNYTPIYIVLKATLPRAIASHLRNGNEPSYLRLTPGQLQPVLDAFHQLPTQPGLVDALKLLTAKDIRVYIVTNGAQKTTEGYLEKAEAADLVAKVLSCDNVLDGNGGSGVAKPDKRVYEAAWKTMTEDGNDDLWFCTAHAWDLVAARGAG